MAGVLVGRATELSALRSDVEGACAGRGCLLTIRGEAGIGKTALARALADDASELGSQVLWTTLAVPADAPTAWPWPPILRALGDDQLAESVEAGPVGVRLFEDVVAAIVRAATEQPLTIIIDDADRMTDVGRDLLVFAGAQLSLRRVLIVVTARRALERVERTGTTLILEGLAQPAVGALLREHGVATQDDIVRAVHIGTRGNPSDVIDLVPAVRSSATADDVVEAMITFAENEAKRGGRRAADRWVRHAYDIATSGDQIARVALLLHALGATTSVSDDDRIELLQTASGQAQDPALRAKVLASIAREAYHLDAARELGSPRQTADDALALARQTCDPDVLAFCLLAKHDTEWRPGSAVERLQLADEIVQLRPGLEGVLARYVAYLELGDRRADREFDRFMQVAARDERAHAQYVLSTRRAMRAIMIGDFTNAERLIDESVQLAKHFGEPDGPVVALNQRFELHYERGNRAVLLPMLERAREVSSHAAIVASLALARLDANDPIGAQALVGPYSDVELDLVKPEYGRVWVLSMLGEAFARLGLHEATARAAAAMLPFAGTNVVVGGGVVFHGAVDHHVGTLLAASGQTDAAEAHLRAALATHERVSAVPWIARTAAALGEHERARRMRAGWEPASAAMSFDGSLWTIAFAGTTVTMKDAKGLRDIARLVSAAGSEIGAADLAGAGDEARLGADTALDAEARRAYRARIDVLEETIERADRTGDSTASDAAITERDALVHELGAAVGLAGRNRRLGDATERARKAVSARIRETVRNIDGLHPELAAHLRDAIATGANCCYRPDPPVKWEVR